MSESESAMDDAKPVLVTESRESAGSMLRAAREKAGLHVAALAVAIKIPVKKLEALEADQLHDTHDVVFTRALASSVCRALKIDAKPILDALPQTVVRELHVDDNGINAPFAVASAGHSKPLGEFILQPRVMLVLVLCIGAVLIVASGWWGQHDVESSPAATVADELTTSQVMAPVVIPAAPLPDAKVEVVGNTATGVPSVPAVEPVAVSSAPTTPVSSPNGTQVPATSLRSESKSLGPQSSPVVPGSELVMSFKAKHQSVWVEVVDAKGEVRLRRNVGAGERVECGGVLPLVVVIGRADSVDVEVRGKPFNFAPYAKDNVARFEVK